MAKKYTLPNLPYEYDALEPVVSAEIMKLHHQKHHNGYVTNLNIAIEAYAKAESDEDLSTMVSLQSAICFNAGGHINHSIFWTNLAPKDQGGGSPPTGALADAINKQWGSLEAFIEQFNATAGPLQGSGWCWLAFCDATKELNIHTCSNQDPLRGTWAKNFPVLKVTPLLGIDVWEHAYYLQYKNARPEYLKAIWQAVNWANVEERYAKACETCASCVM